jgi:hypothetical protein
MRFVEVARFGWTIHCQVAFDKTTAQEAKAIIFER